MKPTAASPKCQQKRTIATPRWRLLLVAIPWLLGPSQEAAGWAIGCRAERSSEGYTGVRYKFICLEQELSETKWVLLFGGNKFSQDGKRPLPHSVDLMIKVSHSKVYADGACWPDLNLQHVTLDECGFQFGVIDNEDARGLTDNDIAIWSADPLLFPRQFANIDAPEWKTSAGDKIMAEYQVQRGGKLDNVEVSISFVRAEETRLARDKNYFVDPDDNRRPASHADILYRRWVGTFEVPSRRLKTTVDCYVNAEQGKYLLGKEVLNFMWENKGRARIESDHFRVIIFDPEVQRLSGEWVPVKRFFVDWRTAEWELPRDRDGRFLGGFRPCVYRGKPALEASFGYGLTDYVIDRDPVRPDPPQHEAVIDLAVPETP